ncbi:MAG: hypothetical protein ACYC6L_11415 [Anaerolineae bacterium]
MDTAIYRHLANYLDTLPDGFPPTKGDADIKLLAYLYSEPEAALAPYVAMDLEPASAIAARAGLPEAETASLLEAMAAKGTLMSLAGEDGSLLYRAVPFVIGIYEFQVNNLNHTFLRLLRNYWMTSQGRPEPKTIPQTRIIPVAESIPAQLEVLAYEQVESLIAGQERFAVAPCICRRKAHLQGRGCDALEESCLVFGDWAEYYVRTGRGRAVDQGEVRAILERANQANLVLEPSNSQDISFMCTCCGCCCGILGGLKRLERPADAVVNPYIAELDSEACRGCWTCLERCQMGALVEDGDRVRLKQERCIGCGLCTTTCTGSALRLVRKANYQPEPVPADLTETWGIIRRQQARKD